MSEIILCCGKVGSGKTRFATFMEQFRGWFHLSADEWMLHFYGEIADKNEFRTKLETSKEMICQLAESLLARQQNVILDFGFWTKTERTRFKFRFEALGFKTTLLYFPVTFNEQIENIKKRNAEQPQGSYCFTELEIIELNAKFEEPDAIEVVEVRAYCRLNQVEYS
jgi:predicted kinase